MAQPVWVLSVDLQTKTATFQSGLADAAKSARGAFTDIKGGAGEMGKDVGYSMFEARHGVMLLGEEFGVHLPRALTSFIASIGPIGAAMEAAFPFLAIAFGATLLIEHLVKLHEEGEKLTQDQVKFGTAVQTAFNQLDQKILQAQIRSDELRNNHLAALHHELEMIDRQSMDELVHAFGEVAKAAETIFGDIQSHWYTFGNGATGAKNALDVFYNKYESLLSQGKDKEASDLLKGTRESAERTLATVKEAAAVAASHAENTDAAAAVNPALTAANALAQAKADGAAKELMAQQAIVDALRAGSEIESKAATLKALDQGNAKTQTGNEESARRAAMNREAVESQLRMGESAVAADRSIAESRLAVEQASVAQRLAVEVEFAGRERDVKMAANQGEIAALDKSGKDYLGQLQALNDKALEITQAYETEITQAKERAAQEQAARDVQILEQGIREQVDQTQQGTAARLAAIDAGIRVEQAHQLQNTDFYRGLLTQRVQVQEEMALESAKLSEEAGKEDAANQEKMGALLVASMRDTFALINSARHTSDAERAAQETAVANEEYAIKAAALQREVEALDKGGKDYQNKLKALQDQETQLVRAHENQLTQIKEKAEEERNQRILSAEQHFDDTIASGLTNLIMRHQTFTQMMTSLANQVVSGMLESAIKSILADDMTKERDAAAAARKAFLAGMQLPFPANIVAAPVLAAGAFSAVMAFQGGTDSVPGIGSGDKVPAMLEPGEGVVPGGVMEGLRDMAKNGGFNQKAATVLHMRNTYHVHTIDGDGMRGALEKHSDDLERHIQRVVRKANG